MNRPAWHGLARAARGLPPRPFARVPANAERYQDQPADILRFCVRKAANSSDKGATLGEIPCQQGIFRDLTGNFVCPETAWQTADRQRFRASARAASASIGGQEA
jgi:hypothetical protein